MADRFARLENAPGDEEGESAQRVDLVLGRGQSRIDCFREILKLDPRIGFPDAVVEQQQQAVGGLVMFVLDVADDFLDHILDRDKAFGSAEFVDDDGEVDLAATHPREQFEHAHRFGHEQWGADQAGDGAVASGIEIGDEHVLDVDHADDRIETIFEHGKAAVARLGEGADEIVEADRGRHRDNVAAGDRDFAGGAVAEVEQVAQHLAFVRAEVTADRFFALGVVDRFLDLVAQRRLAIVAEQ